MADSNKTPSTVSEMVYIFGSCLVVVIMFVMAVGLILWLGTQVGNL